MGGTGTGPMMKGMGVWEVMQAYAGSEVATGSWRVHLSQDDIGSVGSCGSCSCRRKTHTANVCCELRGQNAQRRNEEMNE